MQPNNEGSSNENAERSKLERRAERKARQAEMRQSTAQQRRMQRVGMWVVVAAVLVGTVVGLSKLVSTSVGPSGQVPLTDEITAEDWVKGNPNATLTVVEYSDFQCPACNSYHPLLKRLVDELGSDMRFVYRHFPLESIHKNAKRAAQAAEAAGKQGKFWEYHDLLFQNQSKWANEGNPEASFRAYARQLGLNEEQFATDYASDEVAARVRRDQQSGTRASVNSTPSIFINGEPINPPGSYDALKSLVESKR